MNCFKSNQRKEEELSFFNTDFFQLCYGFYRARETMENGEKSQDYLVFQEENGTLAFALCDGVSLSFYGDAAAKFLGDKLVAWLMKQDEILFEEGKALFHAYLETLTEEATKHIEAVPVNSHLPELVKSVLEEKRNNGSEAMFVCGRIDALSNGLYRLFLSSGGDIRVRFFSDNGEEVYQSKLETGVRWSTKRGLIGEKANIVIEKSCAFHKLLLYSDGLALLDEKEIGSDEIKEAISQSLATPESDDVSLLEITL
ncbi:hypothetical protein [Priestia endophytica]|uniref:hypothetical protein n=1 Tax=Priestia endophytica TaxID=135735 RepID=UPI00203EDA4D|nr:hypothetical protein [Priestia endophytica]MCM3538976.1 hypothetical protein [Priestia endophytica]